MTQPGAARPVGLSRVWQQAGTDESYGNGKLTTRLCCCSQDLRREFVENLIYPAVQANCIYEVRRVSLLMARNGS